MNIIDNADNADNANMHHSQVSCLSHESYVSMFDAWLEHVKAEDRYRQFKDIMRHCGNFPYASFFNDRTNCTHKIVVWCSNDYLGMGQNTRVLKAMHEAIDSMGAGSGGTRNISGTTHYHVLLEEELAHLHQKESALLFSSGYNANDATLSTLGRLFGSTCVFISDQNNHASMIEGMRRTQCVKKIFRHNDVNHLESILKKIPASVPKIIVIESVYSMDGDCAPLESIVQLAEKFNALTYLDEVHAVGVYGYEGAGYAQSIGIMHKIDIIAANLSKGFGVMGGYIAASRSLVDVIRSFASGFIFSTSLCPVLAAGALESVRYLRSSQGRIDRASHKKLCCQTRLKLQQAGVPVRSGQSHILIADINSPKICQTLSDYLLYECDAYIQAINYPTVPKWKERLRITPSLYHNDHMINQLQASFIQAFQIFHGATEQTEEATFSQLLHNMP